MMKKELNNKLYSPLQTMIGKQGPRVSLIRHGLAA